MQENSQSGFNMFRSTIITLLTSVPTPIHSQQLANHSTAHTYRRQQDLAISLHIRSLNGVRVLAAAWQPTCDWYIKRGRVSGCRQDEWLRD